MTYPNGTVAEYTYDTLNRLTYLKNRKSTGEIISSYTYTLGPSGNRIRVVEHTGRVVNYTYDNLYRLTQEAITDSDLGNETITYTYDAFGNRLTKTDSSGTTNYTYDANDRLLTEGSNSYTYDNNGNTASKTNGIDTTTYTYDYENRLISVQTPTSVIDYIYDADGIRVRSIVDGTVTDYLADKNRDYAQVLEERDSAGSLIVEYTYGDDLISQHRGGAVSYYHYDAQSSTRILTNAAETVTDTYTYDAFGSLTDQAGVTANNYLYTGEQYDANVGFYYLRARYYDQGVGRFTTQDPWQGNVFEPVTLHRYLYANANPVMFVDPAGEQILSVASTITTMTLRAIIVGTAAYGVYAWYKSAKIASKTAEVTQELYRELEDAYSKQDFDRAAEIDSAIRDLRKIGLRQLMDCIWKSPTGGSIEELAVETIIKSILSHYRAKE